jgi:hypothetical protein
MRTFLLLAIMAGAAFWAARRTPGFEPQWRVLRGALYLASGIFAALLLSAMVQALLDVE